MLLQTSNTTIMSSEGDLRYFTLEFVDTRKQWAVKEVVTRVHLQSSENGSINLISHSEGNTCISFLESSFNSLSLFRSKSLSWDDSDRFLLIKNSVIIDIFIGDFRKWFKSIVFNKSLNKIIGCGSKGSWS